MANPELANAKNMETNPKPGSGMQEDRVRRLQTKKMRKRTLRREAAMQEARVRRLHMKKIQKRTLSQEAAMREARVRMLQV
jgi:hypothetical protein